MTAQRSEAVLFVLAHCVMTGGGQVRNSSVDVLETMALYRSATWGSKLGGRDSEPFATCLNSSLCERFSGVGAVQESLRFRTRVRNMYTNFGHVSLGNLSETCIQISDTGQRETRASDDELHEPSEARNKTTRIAASQTNHFAVRVDAGEQTPSTQSTGAGR
jgi:hypothetical protein